MPRRRENSKSPVKPVNHDEGDEADDRDAYLYYLLPTEQTRAFLSSFFSQVCA
jgi:hypothetical protein